MDPQDPLNPPISRPVRRLRRVLIEENPAAAAERAQQFRESQQLQAIANARRAQGLPEHVSPHAHDAQTFRRIVEHCKLDSLKHSDYIAPRLEEWKHWEKMRDWDSRNALLQELTSKLRRREATPEEVTLLLTLCRPVWRAVARQLRRYGGADLAAASETKASLETARRVNELDRDELDQAMQSALLDALAGCPQPFPRLFFPWLKETLSYRALKYVRDDIAEHATHLPADDGIRVLLDEVLADPSRREAAALFGRGAPDHAMWLRTLDLPTLFDLAEEYAPYARGRSATERAVERLPLRQRRVIEDHYFGAMTQAEIAGAHGLASSTVRNTHRHALSNLRRDDDLFDVLEAVGIVRDNSRRQQLDAQGLCHVHVALALDGSGGLEPLRLHAGRTRCGAGQPADRVEVAHAAQAGKSCARTP